MKRLRTVTNSYCCIAVRNAAIFLDGADCGTWASRWSSWSLYPSGRRPSSIAFCLLVVQVVHQMAHGDNTHSLIKWAANLSLRFGLDFPQLIVHPHRRHTVMNTTQAGSGWDDGPTILQRVDVARYLSSEFQKTFLSLFSSDWRSLKWQHSPCYCMIFFWHSQTRCKLSGHKNDLLSPSLHMSLIAMAHAWLLHYIWLVRPLSTVEVVR